MHDLHTLGDGTDSIAYTVNDHGQVDGEFLWENGEMKDLGTIGGTFVDPSFCCALNERGEVVGGMTTEGDTQLHPFLWDGRSIKDLQALGGSFGEAIWLNDSGEVVGFSTTSGDQALYAFLWRDGVMTNLNPASDTFGEAEGINESGQVVGASVDSKGNSYAFLWENGGPMVSLENLVLPVSDVTATEATFINDQGEITANGIVPRR